MLKARLILAAILGPIGALLGTTLGMAGSVAGFFFGAGAGTPVFGAIGAALGWFAAKDVDAGIAKLDPRHPAVRSHFVGIVRFIGRGLYLAFGLLLLNTSSSIGLFRKKNA